MSVSNVVVKTGGLVSEMSDSWVQGEIQVPELGPGGRSVVPAPFNSSTRRKTSFPLAADAITVRFDCAPG